MQEEKGEFGFIKLNKFLMNAEEELQSHAQINQKNLNAMVQLNEQIQQNCFVSLFDSLNIQRQVYNNCVNLKYQNAVSKHVKNKELAQISTILETTKKKENNIKNLEQNLKKLSEKYKNLLAQKEKENQEDNEALKIYKKAGAFFTKYFQYNVRTGMIKDNKCFDITFIFDGEESKYPIRFVFDKENNLLRFDAGALLSNEEQALLYKRYKESNNNVALFCTLRNAAIKKRKA